MSCQRSLAPGGLFQRMFGGIGRDNDEQEKNRM